MITECIVGGGGGLDVGTIKSSHYQSIPSLIFICAIFLNTNQCTIPKFVNINTHYHLSTELTSI